MKYINENGKIFSSKYKFYDGWWFKKDTLEPYQSKDKFIESDNISKEYEFCYPTRKRWGIILGNQIMKTAFKMQHFIWRLSN